MKKKILTAACLLAFGSTAFAAEEVQDRHGFYGHVGWYDLELDSYWNSERTQSGGLGLGWFFNKNLALEVEYNYFDEIYNNTSSADTDVESTSINLLLNDTSWIGSTTTYPFMKLGYGELSDKYGVYGPDLEDSYYKVGIGLQHFATDNVYLRAGIDLLDSGDRGDHKVWYFSYGYFFGDTVKSGAAPAPKPVEKAKDSDGDGVLDANDQCPGTPAGAAVDANGCPLDSDNDGVYDYQDACPGTAPGVQVDEKGCEVKVAEEVVVDMRLNFDTNKYEIKPEMVAEIAKVAEFLRQYPDVNAEIQGHTDSVGSSAYNQGLSERRANSVKDYLVSNFGIDASRLTAKGYGEEQPIADNSTEEGRALNRRAEAHAETMTTK
ncbi:MAG: OmpA family protein [Kangiella sp.]|nr:OmpA family protein [Kangiella sp.]